MLRIASRWMCIAAVMVLASCKKETCKECFTEETNKDTGEVVTSNIGELCGEELDRTDGSTFATVNGTARTYCE
jgi:hypothetical protein